MTDHKFEPGQLVLVRDSDEKKWILKHFSHSNKFGRCLYYTTDSNIWTMCAPFNDETKHLQNTTQPYEQPVQYAFGQRVEVLIGEDWETAVFLLLDTNDERVPYSVYGITSGQRWVTAKMIRP